MQYTMMSHPLTLVHLSRRGGDHEAEDAYNRRLIEHGKLSDAKPRVCSYSGALSCQSAIRHDIFDTCGLTILGTSFPCVRPDVP